MRTAIEHYRHRFMQQLLTESTATYWERRAAAFDEGSGYRAACLAKAYVIRHYGIPDEALKVIEDVLAEQTHTAMNAAGAVADARARRSVA